MDAESGWMSLRHPYCICRQKYAQNCENPDDMPERMWKLVGKRWTVCEGYFCGYFDINALIDDLQWGKSEEGATHVWLDGCELHFYEAQEQAKTSKEYRAGKIKEMMLKLGITKDDLQ